MKKSIVPILAVAVIIAVTPLSASAAPIVDVSLGTVQVEWQPNGDFAGMRLRVSGPLGVVEQDFAAGENPLFDLRSMESVADGLYTWEIVAAPRLDEGVRRAMAEARAAGDGGAEGRLQANGALPNAGSLVQSGSFRVVGGAIFQPTNEPEPSPNLRRVTSDATGGDLRRVTAEDQVIPDDLIVQGSICVGIDCVNNENFSFDTLRLKENNTRLTFIDTSATSFPAGDWQIRANDSASGGANFLSIDWLGTAAAHGNAPLTTPFRVDGAAPNNALKVDSTGRVGLRTASPVLDLHIATGNTPGIRLEQTNASGFTAQTWDIAGNEANFFVRDVTSGSRLPFRIRPGAPTSSIDVSASGNVGVGTASPTRRLHVITTGAADNTVLEIQNDGPARFRLNNSANGEVWNIGHQSPGGSGLVFSDVGDAVSEMLLDVAGNMILAGTLTTGGPTCGGGCDFVFDPAYPLESIEEHAARMWSNSFLPAVGPTQEGAPFNLTEKTGGILNELETAHIYIEQLNDRVKAKGNEIDELKDRLARLEALLVETVD